MTLAEERLAAERIADEALEKLDTGNDKGRAVYLLVRAFCLRLAHYRGDRAASNTIAGIADEIAERQAR